MGETKQGDHAVRSRRGVLLGVAVTVAVGAVAGAVVVTNRVRSLNSDLAASNMRSETTSKELVDKIGALESELDRARAELQTQESVRAEEEESARRLRRANRAMRFCASESWPRGRPRVTLVPSHGRPGARIDVVGHCFTSPFWRGKKASSGYGIGLSTRLDSEGNPDPELRKSRCDLVAGKTGTFEIDSGGRMRGRFVVPGRGRCAQTKEGHRIGPGRYDVIVGCRRCAVARFRVTTAASEKQLLPACSAGDWRLSLRPERVGGVLLTVLRADSVAGARCHLSGEVTLTLVGPTGDPLPVDGNPLRATVDAIVGDGITATWKWTNWCGPVGSVSLRATMHQKNASVTSGAGPRCEVRGRSSLLRMVPEWTSGVQT